MPRFFSGDELGTLKSIKFSVTQETAAWKADLSTLVPGITNGSLDKGRAVQQLVATQEKDVTLVFIFPSFLANIFSQASAQGKLAAARADSSAALYRVEGDNATVIHEWQEPRMKNGQHYVGLAISEGYTSSYTLRQDTYK